MFSITTMASSTTKPVAMMSAMSVRLLIAEAGEVHDAEGADERQRHGDGSGSGCAVALRRKTKITATTSADGEQQLELRVVHRGADGDGAVGEDAHLDRRAAAPP